MTGQISVTMNGLTAFITISNPERLNAMSMSMWRALDDVLAKVPDDARCIVLQGSGSAAFVSGADISEFGDKRNSSAANMLFAEIADKAMDRLFNMPQPTIAKISGYCFGAGVAISLCCDLRLASDTAIFSVPAARLGLGYGTTSVKHLLDAVSVPVATEVLMTGRRYSAEEALSIGLVNRVFPSGSFEHNVDDYINTIAENAPLTIRSAKQAIRGLSEIRNAQLEEAERLISACFASEDYAEGTRAFMEKRKPRFMGR